MCVLENRVYVRVDRFWDRVSVCTCGQNLGSCECLNVWRELRIV